MTGPGTARGALAGIRVLDLSRGMAGPIAAMFLADFGAEAVRVEDPGSDPDRNRPGFAMWNRNKRGLALDPTTAAGQGRLEALLRGADVCVTSRTGPFDAAVDRDAARRANPALVVLEVPPFLGDAPWAGEAESPGLLAAMTGVALRQSSFEGGPVEPVFPYLLYLQGGWAAAAGVAALIERESSGHGQVVTAGGVHAAMVASSASLVIDPTTTEVPASHGPGGPHPMYTRYQCADGGWLFMATLTTKFQDAALSVLGLGDLLEDERIGGRIEAMLLPANRGWVRERFVEVFASRSSEEWLAELRAADVPVAPLLHREDWMDSALLRSVGMRVELEDPVHGPVVTPGNPVNLVATPWRLERPAPAPGGGDQVDWAPRPAPGAPERPTGGPLAGLRVLDLGTILAGPYAGTLLAELGADVIKVEIPAGDSWRERGMPYIRGQRGVAIDLQSAAGLEAFHALVRTADAVLDNYRAGVLERLGIDYEHLRLVKPDIVSVSITGFGPSSREPAFDPLLQARSGMMRAQGGDSEPVFMTVAVNDVTSATLAALGTALALFHRVRSGAGQAVWLSLAGTSAFAQSEELVEVHGRRPPVVGGRDFRGADPLHRFYETADGWVRLEAPSVDRLVEAGLLEAGVVGDGLSEHLAAALGKLGRDEAVRVLRDAGVPAAPARRLAELTTDPEYADFEVFTELERPGMTTVLAPGRYVRFSRTQQDRTLTPPGVGEHTAEVLAEAGLDADDIDKLAQSGAVRLGEPMVFRPMAAYR
jgi:crotonobetainyl-CoA:carnitine CoA-transferase CaiB-like acyl-CoA transferase